MCSIFVTQELYAEPELYYDELLLCIVFALTSFLDTEDLLLYVMVLEFLRYYSSRSCILLQ